MVMRRFYILAILGALGMGACTMTEVAYGHENPLDPIYDSGGYRLVLTGQPISSTQATLSWGAVYNKNDKGSVSTVSGMTGTTRLLYKATAPSPAQIDIVKRGDVFSGQDALLACPVTLGIAGACNTTTTTGYVTSAGYYILEVNFTHSGKTGYFYSNFVVIQ
jgi:hypothetical protein